MKYSLYAAFLLLFCMVTLVLTDRNIEDTRTQYFDLPSEATEQKLHKRSVDTDSNQEYGPRCISCGKLGGYSASASASAAASASSSGGVSDGSDSSYSIPAPTYSSTYNSYPSHSSYSKSRKTSSYGTHSGSMPTRSYQGRGDGSSASYSSSSQYSSQPQYQSSLPSSLSGHNMGDGSSSSYSSSSQYSIQPQYQSSLPSSSFGQNMGDGSSSSYSSSSQYSSQPQYQSSLPSSSSGQNSGSSYYYSQSDNTHAQPNSYSQHSSYGDSSFDREIARMRQEMNHGNHFSNAYPTSGNSGGSHKSEYSSESKYINGKQVYEKKTEKRYKDGQIVHDSHIEKGPEELGTSDGIATQQQPSPYQSSQSYDRQYGESNSNLYTPSSAASYSGYPREYGPVSKESTYSELRSSSNQPLYHTNRQYPVDSYSHENSPSGSYFPSRSSYRTPVSTKVVESSYDESKFTSHKPRYFAPISNTFSNEETVNITSSSSSTNNHRSPSEGETEQTNGQANYLPSEDIDSDELETPDIPYNSHNPTAFQSSRTSYNKENRYSSGTSNIYNNVAPEDTPPIREPYTGTPSLSTEAVRDHSSTRQTSATNNNQRYDISPYHDNQEPNYPSNNYEPRPMEDRHTTNTNNYEARRWQGAQTANTDNYEPRPTHGVKTTSINKSSQYYGNYKPHYSSGAETGSVNNYDDRRYNQDQTRVNSMPYRKPSYTRLPSRWMEIKTTYKYRNGKLIGESRHNKVFEDGVLINQNTTERTREQMANEGIDVLNLDLKLIPVQQPATIKSSEEIRYIQETSANQPSSRLPSLQPYSPQRNTVENSFMESKASYSSGNVGNSPEHIGAGDLRTRGYSASQLSTHHQPIVQPQTSEQRHETFEEEEFVNGEKVYDLYHERRFKDNKLVHENKTELLPKDLGVNLVNKSGSYFTRQMTKPRQYPMTRDGMFSQNNLHTSCLSCSTRGQHNYNIFNRTEGHTSSSILGPVGASISARGHGNQAGFSGSGTTLRKDVNIEEHYENGRLVKGKEENKKWTDGTLVDSKLETYDEGPSRTKQFNFGTGPLSAMDQRSSSTSTQRSQRIDSCHVNPCQNEATCRMTATNKHICLCKFGFKGDFCETAYCPSRFCRYGGACSIANDHHLCICQKEFTGHRCKTRVHQIRMSPSSY